MTRITTQYQFQNLVNNVQSSFRELSRLQTMLQTQQKMRFPSDDPVAANEAIRIERNLGEVRQYTENVAAGSDLLNYSDQILSNLQSPITTAMAKASEGINGTVDTAGRQAIAQELTSILKTFISVGNTKLGDKSIFAGRDYLGDVFEEVGNDVIFKGDTTSFAINVFGNESIQSNVTSEQAFGALSTQLESERNLDPRVSEMSISKYVPAGTLVLNEGTHTDTSSLSVTIAASSDIDAVVKAINAAANTKSTTAQTDSQTAAQTAFTAAGGTATIDWTTTPSITPGTSAQMAAFAQERVLSALSVTAATMTPTQKSQVEAAVKAARNTFAASEFFAAKTRGGLVITHASGNHVSANEASSTKSILHDLELASQNNNTAYVFSGALTATNLSADQTLTFASANNNQHTVSLLAGDTITQVAQRINRSFNQSSLTNTDFNQVVASVDSSTGTNRLVISSNQMFKLTGVTEIDATTTTATNSVSKNGLYGYRNRIEDLNGGGGIQTGQVNLETVNPSGYNSTITIRASDSLDFVIDQVNNLAGYEAALNTAGTGIDIQSLSRYSVDLSADTSSVSPAVNDQLTLTSSLGFTKNLTFTGTTLSQIAEEINALSSSDFKIHAEVNGSLITLSSNEKFSYSLVDNSASTTLTKSQTNLTSNESTTLFDSTLLQSLGLGKAIEQTTDTTLSTTQGRLKGSNILARQTRLSELNNGAGVSLGKLKFTIGSTQAEVDLSAAVTLRDVKDLVETALPDSLTVGLNTDQNGFSLTSKSSAAILVEEVGSGSTGRTLGLIPAPFNFASGTTINGKDVNPILDGTTLLKDLNAGSGIDTTGFTLRNGYKTDTNGATVGRDTRITFDTDGDGVNDLRTVQDFVNHINQKSKQDEVFIQASFDESTGKIKFESQLSSADMKVTELAKVSTIYRSEPISNAETNTVTVSDGTNSYSLNFSDASITGTGLARAQTIVNYINGLASADATTATAAKFSIKAEVNEDGNVEITSDKNISVSSTGTTAIYSVAQDANPTPIIGTMGSDFGLLGAFSDSTLLSEINNGFGFNPGSFKIEYGNRATNNFTIGALAAPSDTDAGTTLTETITLYNENASTSASITMTEGQTVAALVTAMNTALTTAGLNNTYVASTASDGKMLITGTKTFKLTTNSTTNSYVTQYNDTGTLDTVNATSATIDLEFATTLGDIKRAVESATSNAVLVDYGHANRLQFRLASGNTTQLIKFSEINGTSTTAQSLGLMTNSILQGRELRDGSSAVLSATTTLNEIGIDINKNAATNSTENNLIILTADDSTTINVSSLTTVGDIINAINQKTSSDNQKPVKFEAKIVDGKYITIENKITGATDRTVRALSSDFSEIAEKLGFITDPTLSTQPTSHSIDLNPTHQADNFFSALKNLIREFEKGTAADENVISANHTRLERMFEKYLIARAEAGGRIARFETLKVRFEDEELQLEDLFGKKTTTDIIDATQKFLTQQQVYEAGLASASRILGLSLFSFL